METLIKDKLQKTLKNSGKIFHDWPIVINYLNREAYRCHLEILQEIESRSRKTTSLPPHVLDIGCGYGVLPITLSRLGFKCYGLDVMEHLDGYAPKIMAKHNVHLDLVDVEKEKFPHPEGFFDYVVCEALIEHLHNSPKLMMTEILRVLKKNGCLILLTPNFGKLRNRVMSLLKYSHPIDLKLFYNSSYPYRGHIRELTVMDVRKIFKWSGFKVDNVRTFNLSDSIINPGNKSTIKAQFFNIIIWFLKWLLFYKENNDVIIAVAQKRF